MLENKALNITSLSSFFMIKYIRTIRVEQSFEKCLLALFKTLYFDVFNKIFLLF